MFPRTLFGFYWSVIKSTARLFWPYMGVGLIGETISAIEYPLIFKWTFQVFEAALVGDTVAVGRYLAYVIALYAIGELLDIGRSMLSGYFVPIAGRKLSYDLYWRIYQNDMDYFINKPAGQITNMVSQIKNGMEQMINDFYVPVFGAIIGFFTLGGMVLGLDPILGVIIFSNAILRSVWQFWRQKHVNRVQKQWVDANARVGGMRVDSIGNVVTVKLFANTKTENDYIYKESQQQVDLKIRRQYMERVRWIPQDILWYGLRVVLIMVSAWLLMQGQLTISGAAFALTAFGNINQMFRRINDRISKYSEARATALHAWDDVMRPITVADAPGARVLRIKSAGVEFDNVSFGYGSRNVLHNFDLVIKPGERVGIVGLSGAGKTTLVSLLLRMYDVKSGAIRIAGSDLRDVTQDSLRRNISLVPQESVLFNRTILENIRYGRPGASRAAVIEAAKKANIHDFIISQADGYDTLVGNRGIKLSGGQRQRIAIARAILKDAPILVLDEATSALDSKNEILIQGALSKIMRGKTTIAIAHRLSTLRNMDRIVVMQRGKIVEQGSHAALLRRGGLYKKLWSMQGGEFFK